MHIAIPSAELVSVTVSALSIPTSDPVSSSYRLPSAPSALSARLAFRSGSRRDDHTGPTSRDSAPRQTVPHCHAEVLPVSKPSVKMVVRSSCRSSTAPVSQAIGAPGSPL